jgi:hypothetical protein
MPRNNNATAAAVTNAALRTKRGASKAAFACPPWRELIE